MPAPLSFVEPQIPTLVDEPPSGDEWQHEIKYDGYRTELVISNSGVRAFTRRGYDWTDRYQPVVAAARSLDCSSAILDGEMIVQDEQGRSDFHNFRTTMTNRPEALVFMAFDLLHLDGADLRAKPLSERRARLHDLIGGHDPSRCLQFSEHVVGNGAAMLEAADNMGLEGIVSKRMSSRYRSGPSKAWLKTKCLAVEDFVVIGTERGDGPSSALLARETNQGLTYAGSAFVTLSNRDRDRFWQAVERLGIHKPPIPMAKRTGAQWLEPCLRVRARYLKGSDKLRHATLAELLERRDD